MARRNLLNNPNPDTKEELELTYAEAVARIKASRNRQIFISVHFHAPVAGEPNKVFPLFGNIKASAPDALQFLEGAYGRRFQSEALVRLSIWQTCMFIG